MASATRGDNMIIYMENPQEPTKRLVEQINEFNKVIG